MISSSFNHFVITILLSGHLDPTRGVPRDGHAGVEEKFDEVTN